MQPFLEITLTNIAMATALAVLAALVARVYRRPALSHFLWLLVLLKLVTPPLLPVRVHLPAAWEAALPNRGPRPTGPEGRANQRLGPAASAGNRLASGGRGAKDPTLAENSSCRSL